MNKTRARWLAPGIAGLLTLVVWCAGLALLIGEVIIPATHISNDAAVLVAILLGGMVGWIGGLLAFIVLETVKERTQ